MKRTTMTLGGLALAAAFTVGACSSSSGSADKTGGAKATQAGVDPNAAEQSPPGDIPDNQVFVPYAFPGRAYTVSVPEGWSRTTSGGSTLLACLAGLDEPDGGMVTIAGSSLSRRPETERAAIRAAHIGVLFQTRNLLEHLSVDDNVAMAQRLAGHRDPARREQILDELGISHRRRARPSELSGGEAQRAGLAVALVNDPAVILADEPTGEVDVENGRRIIRHLRARADAGSAVVVVTHSTDVAAAADRTVRFLDGTIRP